MVYPKKVYFNDQVFLVDEQVYEPAEDSFLIAKKLEVTENDSVLEVGTGCGILAVLAAETVKKVVAVDINPHAIECAKMNAETNGAKEGIDFRQGDLFQPIEKGELFSVIVFNSPYLPSERGEEDTWIGKAWAGGQDGRKVIDRFITEAPQFLAEGGRIMLVQSSLSNINQTIQMFREKGLRAEIVGQVKVAFEAIVLVEAKR